VRTNDGEDYAIWFYIAAIVALIIALAGFWNGRSAVAAHCTLLAATMLAFAAVKLRRRILVLAAFVGFIVYLGYLAFDVFEHTVAFPVALATIGIIVILAAVGLQKRYPSLVRGHANASPAGHTRRADRFDRCDRHRRGADGRGRAGRQSANRRELLEDGGVSASNAQHAEVPGRVPRPPGASASSGAAALAEGTSGAVRGSYASTVETDGRGGPYL
jgi:hypothetical protein